MPMLNLAGQRFGRLLAVKPTKLRNSCGCVMWVCHCQCGNHVTTASSGLRSGHCKSCGCWFRDNARIQINKNRPKIPATLKHGGASPKSNPRLRATYGAYRAMLSRCYYPRATTYRFYGAVGVTVCDRWRDPKHGFECFLEDLGLRPDGKTLGRYLDVGPYCRENCAWQSWAQQQEQKRLKRRFIKYSLDQSMRIGPYSSQRKRKK